MSNTNIEEAVERGTGGAGSAADAGRLNRCIALCNACAVACERCASACIAEGAGARMARCVLLDLDCAAICTAAAGIMARNSENAGLICSLCADICRLCAAECASHSQPHCSRCAEACNQCEAECQRMATA
ncbi:four-helix bundle copper-binding protein [Variovorax sp. UC74_104]|uniref:four-helix bundle copper-binding protein n=1 Tax=Variovorax sp. UC74_104 TaxID=3374555 RepID=UPI0037569985